MQARNAGRPSLSSTWGDPCLAVRDDSVRHSLSARELTSDTRVREAHDGQARFVQNLPTRGAKLRAQPVAHVRLVLDHRLHTPNSEGRERQKHLEPDGAARPLNRRGVRIDGLVGGTGHVVRRHAKALEDGVAMPTEEHSGAHRHGKPLVSVAGDRIGVFDPRESTRQTTRQYRRSSPGRVDVEPKAFLPADGGQFFQGVDHSGGRRARGADDHERREASFSVTPNHLRELVGADAQRGVRGNEPDGSTPDARRVRGLHEAFVSTRRRVNRRTRARRGDAVVAVSRIPGRQRDDESAQVRLGPARRKVGEGLRIAHSESTKKQTQDVLLHLDRGRRV